MKRVVWIAGIWLVGVLVGALPVQVAGGSSPEERALKQMLEAQRTIALADKEPGPDTASSRWKPISHELGIWLLEDYRGQTRGRLYVRQNGEWSPLQLEGAGDILAR
jgi:hypothetical protein